MSAIFSSSRQPGQSRSVHWPLLLLCGAVLIITFVDLGNWLSAIDPNFQPKRVYFLIGAVAVLGFIFAPRPAPATLRAGLVAGFAGYCILNMLQHFFFAWAPGTSGTETTMFRAQVPFVGFMVAWMGLNLPVASLARVFVLATIVISAGVLIDFLSPGLFYSYNAPAAVPGRAAGFLVNATKAGEVIMLSLLLALPALTPRRALALAGLAGLAILLTFSRGALAVWLFVFVALWLNRSLPGNAIFILIGGVLATAMTAGLIAVYLIQSSQGVDTSDLLGRLNFFSGGGLTDDSARTRVQVVLAAFQLFLANPVFGAGAGASMDWQFEVGPHNQLLMLASEYGFLGVLGWLSIVWMTVSGRYFADSRLQWLAGAVFVLFSMLTHNMFDFVYWIVALLLFAAMRPRPATASEIRF